MYGEALRMNKPPACHVLTIIVDVAFGKERTKKQKFNNEKKQLENLKLLKSTFAAGFSFSKIFHTKSVVFFRTGIFSF